MQKIFMLLFLGLFLLSCQPEEDDFSDLNLTVRTEIQDSKVKNEANRIRVKNIEALRKLPFPNTKNRKEVLVLGYYEPDDGGGGNFYWDPISTEEDNGGTIISIQNNETGRWKRDYNDTINVKWFGAKGDGINDDTYAIQIAIDVSENVKGKRGDIYNITAALEIEKSNFIFDGDYCTFNFIGVSGGGIGSEYYKAEYVFAITGPVASQENVIIRNINFIGSEQWGGAYSTYDHLQKGWDGGVFGQIDESNYTTTRKNFLFENLIFNRPFNEALALTNTQAIVNKIKVYDGLSGGANSPNTGSVMVRATNNIIIKNSYFEGGYGKAVSTSYVDGVKYSNITCLLKSILGQPELGLYVGHFNRNTNIVNCTVTGSGNNMKISFNATNTVVNNCTFKSTGYIFIQGAQYLSIKDCIINSEGKTALVTGFHSTWGYLEVQNVVIDGNTIVSTDTEGIDEDKSLKVVDLSYCNDLLFSNNYIKGNIYARPIRNAKIKSNFISFTKTGPFASSRPQGVLFFRNISSLNSEGVTLSENTIYTESDQNIGYFHGDSKEAHLNISNNIVNAINAATYYFVLNYATTGSFVYSNNICSTSGWTGSEYFRNFSGNFSEKIELPMY